MKNWNVTVEHKATDEVVLNQDYESYEEAKDRYMREQLMETMGYRVFLTESKSQ